MSKLLSIVVPVFNEENNIKPFLKRIIKVLKDINISYEIIFALDPSTDETEKIISEEIKKNSNIKLILFSRRFGQPAATMAGILNCYGDYCVVIDVDLQDQPELIKEMYNKILQGYEVVYAQRKSRKGETILKKIISSIGYKLINKLSEVTIPENTGDFRIITRKVVEHLRNMKETHGFLRGLVSYVGFKQGFVLYDRDQRFLGDGKYNRLTGSFKIGLNGIIGFSSRPLFLMSLIGLFFSFISFLIGLLYLFQKFFGVDLPIGFPTIVLVITFFTGIQLLGLGLIGEYVGRIYDEVKRRPMYIIDKKLNFKKNTKFK